jgi:hypothetical protein
MSVADLLQRFEEIAGRMFGPVEHQVFEQMREAGLALRFVLEPTAYHTETATTGALRSVLTSTRRPFGRVKLS